MSIEINSMVPVERLAAALLSELGAPESNFILRMQRRADESQDVVWMSAHEYRQWHSLMTRRVPIACVFGKRVVLLDVFDTDNWMLTNGYTTLYGPTSFKQELDATRARRLRGAS